MKNYNIKSLVSIITFIKQSLNFGENKKVQHLFSQKHILIES